MRRRVLNQRTGRKRKFDVAARAGNNAKETEASPVSSCAGISPHTSGDRDHELLLAVAAGLDPKRDSKRLKADRSDENKALAKPDSVSGLNKDKDDVMHTDRMKLASGASGTAAVALPAAVTSSDGVRSRHAPPPIQNHKQQGTSPAVGTVSTRELAWQGEPTYRGHGASLHKHFFAVRINDEAFEVHDCVLVRPNVSGCLWIGQIIDLWENEKKEKRMAIRWYYRAKETASLVASQFSTSQEEVFETTVVHDNPVNSVVARCYVLSESQFQRNLQTAKIPVEQCFFVRRRFIVETGKLVALEKEVRSPPPSPKVRSRSKRAHDRSTGVSSRRKKKSPKAKAQGARATFLYGSGSFFSSASLRMLRVSRVLPCRSCEHNQVSHFLIQGMSNIRGAPKVLCTVSVDCVPPNHRPPFLASTDFVLIPFRPRFGAAISGMPGTGKSATVLQCVRELLNSSQRIGTDTNKSGNETDHQNGGRTNDFFFVEMNAMSTEPSQFMRQFWAALSGESIVNATATRYLVDLFQTQDATRKHCVLLLEEIDKLLEDVTSKTILYKLFDWACHPFSKLLVIGIGNKDFDGRVSDQLRSRMGQARIVFKPYTAKEIQIIAKSLWLDATKGFSKVGLAPSEVRSVTATTTDEHRLLTSGVSFMDDEANKLVSRRVAAVSGDLRRARHIYLEAISICGRETRSVPSPQVTGARATSVVARVDASCNAGDEQKVVRVTIEHVHMAMKKTEASQLEPALRTLAGLYPKLILWALWKEWKAKSKSALFWITQIREKVNNVAKQYFSKDGTNDSNLMILCRRLEETGLLVVDKQHGNLLTLVGFNPDFVASPRDVARIMRDDPVWFKIHQHVLTDAELGPN